MFDASTKYPEGIISGHTRSLGNFDQCYRLFTEIPGQEMDEIEEIYGRHCMVDIELHRHDMPPVNRGPYELEFDPNDFVWEAIRVCDSKYCLSTIFTRVASAPM